MGLLRVVVEEKVEYGLLQEFQLSGLRFENPRKESAVVTFLWFETRGRCAK